MVLDGVVRVLQRMAGEQQDDTLRGIDLACGKQLLETDKGYGRSGLAANAFGSDLGFGESYLRLGRLLDPSSGGFDDSDGLAPGCRIANANRAGPGLSLDRRELASAVCLHAAIERVRAFGLNDGDTRDAAGEAEMLHLEEGPAERRRIGEVASGHDEMVGD